MLDEWLSGFGANTALALRCALHALAGGAIGLYIRELHRRFASSITRRDELSELFPLLTAITVLVIFVVKSSLALSLGLVGALSIVRFRTAIKNPEELVYLFFCIGVGVALGAELVLLTLLSLVVVTVFIVGNSLRRAARASSTLLTVSGDASKFFDPGSDVVELIESRSGGVRVQRLDLEDGQVELRAVVALDDARDAKALMEQIQAALPSFRVSYVDLESML